MKNVAKIAVLVFVIATIVLVAFFKQSKYEEGLDNASEFFDARHEIMEMIETIGKDAGFTVSLDEDSDVINEDGTDFVYDGSDIASLDYVLNFTDGCKGYATFLYYQSGALLDYSVLNFQDDSEAINRKIADHIDAMYEIGVAFASHEIKAEDIRDVVLSDKYCAKLLDYEFEDNFLRNYYEPNLFNHYEYTQSESFIADKKYVEELSVECYLKELGEN